MTTFKNSNFKKRDYEATNIVACVAEIAPAANWIPSDESVLNDLTALWIEGGVQYYGWL